MFYLWIQYQARGMGHYLPAQGDWSGRVTIDAAEAGWRADVSMTAQAVDGTLTLTPPPAFQWSEGGAEPREVKDGISLACVSGEYRFTVRAAACAKEETAMRKLCRPQDGRMTIGRRPESDVCYSHSEVSGEHGLLQWTATGCQYIDKSANGTFINGRRAAKNVPVALQLGDRLQLQPALTMVYLGDAIAVNQPQSLCVSERIAGFDPAALPVPDAQPDAEITVYEEYHRAPRRMQQANEGEIALESPLAKEKRRDLPALLALGPSMTMALPMMVSALLMGGGNRSASIAMVLTSSALAVGWGIFNRRYQQREARRNEEARQAKCRQYYDEMEETLSTEANRERTRLLHNYLSPAECVALPGDDSHRLWERLPGHADFLAVRLGLGDAAMPVGIAVEKPKMALVDDPLRDEPQRLKDRYGVMHDVPILLQMRRYQAVGVLGAEASPWLLQSMALQLAATHSYHDVRMIVIHDRATAAQWAWAKWLPHVYADDSRTLRMVVCQSDAVHEVLSHLDAELAVRLDQRRESSNGKDKPEEQEEEGIRYLPHYALFCTDARLLENHPIMRYLAYGNLGFTMVLQSSSMELLPKECRMVIEAKNTLGAMYEADGRTTGVQFEHAEEAQLRRFSSAVASIRVRDSVESSGLPSLVTFLETYNVRRTEELDVWRFWNENHAWQGLKSHIGMKAGNAPFALDISDKNHGPHGLIAGTTGSGKSVLLQAYILSLAVNYSPTEVQFILIDYKGGGTSEDFRELPHVAGLIDSLQGERAIFRALASIKGEILRREEIFKRMGVNNIDDYMQLFNHDETAEPLGHLIIIVDEFAELKKEQPEFMHELVSAARVGRSLGMHLILATQKPSNSVSDEIAANTRFRVCLRVASKSDSTEMLHRPEAAYLKGMGRCYVQVGNDELFEQVQTAFPGAVYAPEALRSDEEPRMLNDAGQPIKFKKPRDDRQHTETELSAVLRHIGKVCAARHASPARKLWLSELSATLLLTDIPPLAAAQFHDGAWPAGESEQIAAYYAMADDVDMQRYVPVAMNFTAEKNQMLIGLSGSGKTTALQSIAVSLALRYTPEQVNIYAFSLTSKSLSCLAALPHVGDIVYEDNPDEQLRLIDLLCAESERRRKLFSQVMTDSFTQYNRAARQSGGKYAPVPAIVVFIDRMQQLRALGERQAEDKLELVYHLLRAGAGQGIYFVMTAFARNELPVKYQPFIHATALSLNEREDYIDALGARIPLAWGGISACPGRGLIAQADKNDGGARLFEIQVALYGTHASDTERSAMIGRLGEEMRAAWRGALPARIARIPEKPTLDALLAQPVCKEMLRSPELLPFAYGKASGSPVALALYDCFSMLVLGPKRSGKTNLIRMLAKTFEAKNAAIHLTGNAMLREWAHEQGHSVYAPGAQEFEIFLNDLFRRVVPERKAAMQAAQKQGGAAFRECVASFQPVVMLFDDLETAMEKDSTGKLYAPLRFCCEDNVSQYGVYFFASMSHAAYKQQSMREPVMALARARRGVMLQGRLNECDPFDAPVPYAMKNQAYPLGEGLFVADGGAERMVFPRCDG